MYGVPESSQLYMNQTYDRTVQETTLQKELSPLIWRDAINLLLQRT